LARKLKALKNSLNILEGQWARVQMSIKRGPRVPSSFREEGKNE
jgi:hypothetical protein